MASKQEWKILQVLLNGIAERIYIRIGDYSPLYTGKVQEVLADKKVCEEAKFSLHSVRSRFIGLGSERGEEIRVQARAKYYSPPNWYEPRLILYVDLMYVERGQEVTVDVMRAEIEREQVETPPHD
jgi:hypothetical protein